MSTESTIVISKSRGLPSTAILILLVGSACNFQADRQAASSNPLGDGSVHPLPMSDGGLPELPGTTGDGGPCVRNTCTPAGAQYCGKIGDGCGGFLDCGACPANEMCGAFTPGVCGDSACM